MSKKPIDQEYIWSKRNDPDWYTRWFTAENLTNQDQLWSMWHDESVNVVCTVADRIEDQNRLRDMWSGAHPRVREVIARRTTDMEFLWSMRHDTEELVRGAVALRMECPEYQLAEMRTDSSPLVRRMLALNTKTIPWLQYFLNDHEREVREAAKQGIARLLGHGYRRVVQEGTILIDGTSCVPDGLLIPGLREAVTNSGSWITGMMLEKGYPASDDSRYVTLKVRRTITITMEILDGEVTP